MAKVPLTARGAAQLREELKRLKEERPKISEAIAVARAHGDLRENAEYHAAKEQQGLAEARIRDIEGKLANAEIIDVTAVNAGGRVVFGATVHLIEVDDGTEARCYTNHEVGNCKQKDYNYKNQINVFHYFRFTGLINKILLNIIGFFYCLILG